MKTLLETMAKLLDNEMVERATVSLAISADDFCNAFPDAGSLTHLYARDNGTAEACDVFSVRVGSVTLKVVEWREATEDEVARVFAQEPKAPERSMSVKS